MFEGLFQPMHLLVIFGIALLVFGPKKLPELGKGLGESIRGFKSAMKTEENSQPPSRPVLPPTTLEGVTIGFWDRNLLLCGARSYCPWSKTTGSAFTS